MTNNASRGPGFVADQCRISLDGRTLYYKQADGDAPLIAHPIDGGPGRILIDCVAARAFDVGPRGIHYVGCASAERGLPLNVLDPATGRSEFLGTLESILTHGLGVSPDGGTILFTKYTAKVDLMMIENFR